MAKDRVPRAAGCSSIPATRGNPCHAGGYITTAAAAHAYCFALVFGPLRLSRGANVTGRRRRNAAAQWSHHLDTARFFGRVLHDRYRRDGLWSSCARSPLVPLLLSLSLSVSRNFGESLQSQVRLPLSLSLSTQARRAAIPAMRCARGSRLKAALVFDPRFLVT